MDAGSSSPSTSASYPPPPPSPASSSLAWSPRPSTSHSERANLAAEAYREPKTPPMTPDRSRYGAAGRQEDLDGSGGPEDRTAKAIRTRGGTVGGRNASWSGTGRPYAQDQSASPGSYQQQQQPGQQGRLSSSTSARFGPLYASSTASAPTAGRAGGRPSASGTASGIPYSSFQGNGSSPGTGSRSGGPRFSQSGGGLIGGPSSAGGGASQFLLTVVPPMHLPHDPPHPRTSQACSGYGPPEYFRRGTLIPLYPTLSSQLGAIAREYGLPSTGGLVLYLISTSDPSSSTRAALPGSEGFAGEGGPRIGEEAWSLLWGRLFQAEDDEIVLLAENDDSITDDDEYAPPVPPIPRSHLGSLHNMHDDGVQSADARYTPSLADMQASHRFASDTSEIDPEQEQDMEQQTSFSSDADGGESVYSAVGADNVDSATTASGKSRQSDRQAPGSGSGIGRGPPPSLNGGLPSPVSRNVSGAHSARSLASYSSQPHLRQSSRQSLLSNPRSSARSAHYQTSQRSASYGGYPPAQPIGVGYGSSVIVGKVEFDIDWRRGGRSKWYSDWVDGATPASSAASAASPAMSASQSYASSAPSASSSAPDDTKRAFIPSAMLASSRDEFSAPPFEQDVVKALIPTSRGVDEQPASPHPLFLPSLVGSRRQSLADRGPSPPGLPPTPPPPAPMPFEEPPPEELAPEEHAVEHSRAVEPEPELEPEPEPEPEPAQEGPPLVSVPDFATLESHSERSTEPSDVDEDLIPAIEEFPATPELPSSASDTPAMVRPQMRIRTPSGRSRAVESAASGYSIAAVQGHSPNDSADETSSRRETRSPSPAPGGMSTSSSLSSIKMYADSDAASSTRNSGGEYAPLHEHADEDEAAEDGYAPLADDEGSEYGDDQDETVEAAPGSPTIVATAPEPEPEDKVDPLADVFGNDEETWQSMADELSGMRSPVRHPGATFASRDVTDATSLGVHDVRVSSLASTAPAGVVEETVETEPTETLPPQDDVADVRSMMLSSAPPAQDVLLASPIHLDPDGAAATGVFPEQQQTQPLRPLEPVSPATGSRRRNRNGGSDWSASSPTLDAPPSFAVPLQEHLTTTNTTSQRDSSSGLMENLDDLERALAELSPKTSRTARRELHGSPPLGSASSRTSGATSAAGPAPEDVPLPSTASSASSIRSVLSDPQPLAYQDIIDTPPPVSPVPSDSSASSQLSLKDRRPSAPVRNLSLTSDVAGYAKESPAESDAPGTPVHPIPISSEPILEPGRSTTSPLANLAETTPVVPTTPRTPRTSSLSRGEDRTPRNVGLPASPMPLPRETSNVLPPALAQESGPTGLGIDFPSRQSSASSAGSAPPPVPTKRPAPLELQSSTSSAYQGSPVLVESSTPPAPLPPRSPGGRSLRASKPWKSSSDKADKSSESITGEKSPLGAFFAKPSFKFFNNKKSDGPASPTSATTEFGDSNLLPAATSEPQAPIAQPFPNLAQSSPREVAAPFASAPQAAEPVLASTPPLNLYSTQQLRPKKSNDSFRTASAGHLTDDESRTAPAPMAFMPPSPSLNSLRSPDAKAATPSPRSALSDHVQPSSPAAATRYPSSAPATPAAWASPRSAVQRQRTRPKISSEIDDLLSQMNDFGGEDDDVPVKAPLPVLARADSDDASTLLGNFLLSPSTGSP